KQKFGGNEVILAVYQDEHLFDEDGSGIARLEKISGQMKEVPGVRDVLSLAELDAPLKEVENLKRLGNVLDLFGNRDTWQGPLILNPNSALATRFRNLFAGYTHSADKKTAAVVCMLQPIAELSASTADRDPRSTTIAALAKIVHELPGGLAA